MTTGDKSTVRIPLRWTERKRLLRTLTLILWAVLGSILLPAPLLLLAPVIYLIGIAAVGTAAILLVKHRVETEEKRSIRLHGPFIEITSTHIRFPPGHGPAELPIAGTRIERWHLASRYSPTSKLSTPPTAYLMLKGNGHHITLSGCDFIHNMAPFPLITVDESVAKTTGSTFIAVDPETLLSGYAFILKNTVAKIAAEKAAAPDSPNPLMKWGLSAAENLALIQAGADIHATDSEGLNALAHQALPPANYIGYCRPDPAALQVLLNAGISPPDPVTAERWKSMTLSKATSAIEYSEATSFCEWLDRISGIAAAPTAQGMTLAEVLEMRKKAVSPQRRE